MRAIYVLRETIFPNIHAITLLVYIIGLHEYWGILSRVEFYIARACACNICSTRDNISQYSCNNPFSVYYRIAWILGNIVSSRILYCTSLCVQYMFYERQYFHNIHAITLLVYIIGLHEYWGILSRVNFYIARACACNICSTRDNISQYSCNNPFSVYYRIAWILGNIVSSRILYCTSLCVQYMFYERQYFPIFMQ